MLDGPLPSEFAGADYQLAWPRELFRDEAAALLRHAGPDWPDRANLLIQEAFAGLGPRQDLDDAARDDDRFVTSSGPRTTSREAYLARLLAAADSLPEPGPQLPYWSARRRPESPPPRHDLDLFRDWARLVGHLRFDGYLSGRGVYPGTQVASDGVQTDEKLAALIKAELGGGLWPLDPASWDEDTFYDLVEVVHDLVARPRCRQPRQDGSRFWYECWAFAVEPGRVLYRWRVNQLLGSYSVPLRLADRGEDAGRLVRVVDEARGDLLKRAPSSAEPASRAVVEHAIALFRSRNADREIKRSGVVALARLLEERRKLLKTELLNADEGALFEIANKYDLRHRRADQHADYDDAYLDWVFWWYLATVELTNRLLARRHETGA